MRVRFHIPRNAPTVRSAQINLQNSEGRPSEGPVYSEPPRATEPRRYQRGASRSARYASSEGEPSRRQRRRQPAEPLIVGEPPRRSRVQYKNSNRFRKKAIKKKPKKFARTRKIQVKKLDPNSPNFGPFSDIVTMSKESIDLTDIKQAKMMLKDSGLVPLTFKFFVDTAMIRTHKITSAEVFFEMPSSPSELPSYTGTVISPSIMNMHFQHAGARRKQKILETVYVNFENVYDLKEDIEYSMSVTPNRLRSLESSVGFQSAHVVKNIVKEPVKIPLVSDNIIPDYVSQARNFALGISRDPGAEINRLPGVMTDSTSFATTGLTKTLLGTNSYLAATNIAGAKVGPTGSGLFDNKMSVASRSLSKITGQVRTKNIVGFKSRIMPVVITAAIPSMKYNSSIQVRIRLRSQNTLTDQVVAAGSRVYDVEQKYRACLLPVEPPSMSAVALGSGKVEIVTEQQDSAGTHVTIFGKLFDKSGSSNGFWKKLKTFPCKKSAITVLDFSNADYDTACLRAVATNGIGYGSKYSAASVKNWRPVNISSGDSIIGDPKEMPLVIAVNKGSHAALLLRNCQQCSQITVIREDLNTGNVNRVVSIMVNGKEKTAKVDKSVRLGGTYRYYLMYKTVKAGETQLISYKDDVYTHKEVTRETEGINIKKIGERFQVGSKLSLSDDSVVLSMRVSIPKRGLKSIISLMKKSGIDQSALSDISSVRKNFDKFFATRTTRVNHHTGKREILDMVPLDLDNTRFDVVDNPEARASALDSNILGPIPGDSYTYVTKLYMTDIGNLLGKDSVSTTPVQNPILGQSVLKSSSRRFFVTANTLRSILPSEEFVRNDDNFNDMGKAFERNFTGIEITSEVKIPESNNFIRNVSIEKVTNQVMTLSWDYGGDPLAVDHFVICEKSQGKTVPVGAKIAFTTTGKHVFHIAGHELDFDKTYVIKAYNEEGSVIIEAESSTFMPASPIPADILKKHSIVSLQSISAIKGIGF